MPVELHAEDFCPRGDCVEFEPLTLSLGAGSGDFPGGRGAL